MPVDITFAHGVHASLYARGRGTPIVFVHGQLGCRHVWDRVVDVDVVRDRPTLTVDLPWHGASNAALAGGIEKLGPSINDTLDALGWTRVVAVGHSLGALAVLDAARARS